jgi:hypothetical protein
MKELYVEGVATHDDPESCAGVRKGAGEALTGAHVGWAIEPRNGNPGCRRCRRGGRQHLWRRFRESSESPAGSENPSMRGISMRENREVPCSPDRLIPARAVLERLRPHT